MTKIIQVSSLEAVGTFGRVVTLFRHEDVNPFGPMHITVDDGNVDDSHLDFVQRQMIDKGASIEEWELLNKLKELTVQERRDAWDEAFRFPRDESK